MWRLLLTLFVVLILAVRSSASAEGQAVNPCADWSQSASETMFRVAAAQSRTEEGLNLLTDLMERHNAGEAAALTTFQHQRKSFEATVEEAVTASRFAVQEAKGLTQRLKKAASRCHETELHGMRWARWWFDNHGPIVKMRAGYLAAARLDFLRAESIFEEIIASRVNSDNPNYAGLIDRATRSLAILKAGEIPSLFWRQFDQEGNPGKVPPPEYIPKSQGRKP